VLKILTSPLKVLKMKVFSFKFCIKQPNGFGNNTLDHCSEMLSFVYLNTVFSKIAIRYYFAR